MADELSRWDRWFERIDHWIAYVLLTVSILLSVLNPDQTWGDRVITLGLAGIAAAWVLVVYTLAPPARRKRAAPMTVYFAGLMVSATLLMIRDPAFFVFAITGFFHAGLLRPRRMIFVGTGVTSLILNVVLGEIREPTLEALWFLVPVFLIQTFVIGGGIIGAQKLTELSEQRRRTVAELEATLEENAGLHAQLLVQAREAGILDERQRMAREIHDTLAQGLTGVITQIEAAGRGKADPGALQRHLDNAAQLARESLSEARRSVHAVQPEPLEDSPLPDAVAGVVDRWAKLHDVDAQFAATGTERSMHPEIEATLLRVAQEALANVGKHAQASRVGVTLSYMGDLVTLDVRDDGIGFVPGSANGRFGLTAMRQRIERLAGTLDIESEPGGGTAISASVPAILRGDAQ